MSEISNWHYIDGPRRVGPFDDLEWAALVRDGIVGPETKVWNEVLPGWVPYATVADRFPLPDLPEVLEEDGPEPFHPRSHREAEADLDDDIQPLDESVVERDYRVSARSCMRRSWQLYRENALLLGGATALTWFLLFLGSSLPAGLSLIMPLALNGVLIGGLYSLYLKRLRGDSTTAGEAFSGFRRGIFRNLAMRTLIGTMVVYAGLVAAGVALAAMGLRVENTNDPTAIVESIQSFFMGLDGVSLLTVLLLITVCMLPALFLNVCWVFATPLIRDHGLAWQKALGISWRKVQQHPVAVFRVLIYSALVSAFPAVVLTLISTIVFAQAATAVMGVTAILLSLPLFIGSLLAFYEQVFSPKDIPAPQKPEEEVTLEP